MRRHRIAITILLIISCGAISLFILTRPLRPVEPVYQGKSLSEWLRDTHFTEGGQIVLSETSKHAVQEMGTNALPFLLALSASDSQLKLRWAVFFELHPKLHIHLHTNGERHQEAMLGFRALGLVAKPAFPALVRIILETDYSDAINSLTESDSSVIALLVEGLKSPNVEERRRAVFALGCLRHAPELAIPALVQVLNDPDPELRASTAGTLGVYGPLAKSAVPELTKLSQKSNQRVSSSATGALQLISDPASK